MDGLKKWQDIRSQLSKSMKNLPAKSRFEINNKIMDYSEKVLQNSSLSLIYDDYGNQLYEKTSDVQKYLSCQKTGDTFLIQKDDSKLVKTKTKDDAHNTDFIPYDTIEGIHEDTVKHDMDIDSYFHQQNDYLYISEEQNNRKEKILDESINSIKDYINTKGTTEFVKIDKNFNTIIK